MITQYCNKLTVSLVVYHLSNNNYLCNNAVKVVHITPDTLLQSKKQSPTRNSNPISLTLFGGPEQSLPSPSPLTSLQPHWPPLADVLVCLRASKARTAPLPTELKPPQGCLQEHPPAVPEPIAASNDYWRPPTACLPSCHVASPHISSTVNNLIKKQWYRFERTVQYGCQRYRPGLPQQGRGLLGCAGARPRAPAIHILPWEGGRPCGGTQLITRCYKRCTLCVTHLRGGQRTRREPCCRPRRALPREECGRGTCSLD